MKREKFLARKEEIRASLREEFQALALSGQFDNEAAAQAFSLSQRFVAAGGIRGNFHAHCVIDGFRGGGRPDATTASLAKWEFDLNTQGFGGDTSKGLLAGLEGEKLEVALDFCQKVTQAYGELFRR